MEHNLDILIEGCKKYDRLSQEKLYQYFFDDLVRFCKKYFDDKHDIITAMNDGMLNAFNNIDKYSATKAEFKNWLFIIVRNAAISFLRKQKKLQTSVELNDDIQLEVSINPLKNYSEEKTLDFLKTLSVSTRAVFNLFYIEELLLKEVAIILNMKEGTVKWHLNDGRKKLREFFGNSTYNNVLDMINV